MRNLLVSVLAFSLAVFSFAMMSSTSILAADTPFKTVVLNVDKMTCKLCPITVKRALRQLEGVTKVSAKYEGDGQGWAKVTFDPALVEISDLTFATEEAGYPSQLKQKL